jgi:hypothetical protein
MTTYPYHNTTEFVHHKAMDAITTISLEIVMLIASSNLMGICGCHFLWSVWIVWNHMKILLIWSHFANLNQTLSGMVLWWFSFRNISNSPLTKISKWPDVGWWSVAKNRNFSKMFTCPPCNTKNRQLLYNF